MVYRKEDSTKVYRDEITQLNKKVEKLVKAARPPVISRITMWVIIGSLLDSLAIIFSMAGMGYDLFSIIGRGLIPPATIATLIGLAKAIDST